MSEFMETRDGLSGRAWLDRLNSIIVTRAKGGAGWWRRRTSGYKEGRREEG